MKTLFDALKGIFILAWVGLYLFVIWLVSGWVLAFFFKDGNPWMQVLLGSLVFYCSVSFTFSYKDNQLSEEIAAKEREIGDLEQRNWERIVRQLRQQSAEILARIQEDECFSESVESGFYDSESDAGSADIIEGNWYYLELPEGEDK